MKKVIAFTIIFLSLQSQAQAPAGMAEMSIVIEEETHTEPRNIDGYWVVMEVTAYTADECDKTPDHPYYGITASGEKVKEHHTIAAGPSIPFGTKIYIPKYLKCFTVEDRGGAIGDSNIDIYMEDINEVNKFGRQQMWVFVVEGG